MKKIFRVKTHYGFTILETLVAVAMLSLVIGTTMSLVQSSLVANSYAKDEITAKYLAEGGIEYIRNLRDLNTVNYGQSSWMQNIADNSLGPCGQVGSNTTSFACSVDPIQGTLPATCPSGVCPPLRYDSSTGQYSYNSSFPVSRFTRTIQVTGLDGVGGTTYSVKVHVTVTWPENIGTETYTADSYLFNWYTP